MFNNINVEIIMSRIKLDGKRMPDLKYMVSDNNKYLNNNTFNIYRLMEDTSRSFSDFDELSCNVSTIFTFKNPKKFSDLKISFKAATYTEIAVILENEECIRLAGENKDYLNNDYSFNSLKDKYKGLRIVKIICEGSYGSEEFMSLTIN